ncbi:uncharacterized protein LOC124429015 [Vespa crabro]|uniref:uncharacterized protein LOC124429015 n=1 Tax=Vespa crabro TaxID=7445 RepID=UPI001F0249BD|nr:uncharacterized protein LOC124429015 [Vespa crabro]
MNADKYSSAKDIFDQLFSRNIVETLVSYTNEYGKHLFETKHSSNFVLQLMQPCLGKGHHFFMDNFYNRSSCQELLTYKTHTTGTLYSNRKDLCIWNSYFIYQQFHKSTTFLQFRDLLMQSLITLPNTEISGKNLAALTSTRARPKQINSLSLTSTGSTQQHFLEKIP